MWEAIALMIPYAIAYSMPLMITALGGLYSERAGVVNIGLEGLMVIGSFAGAFTIQQVHPGFVEQFAKTAEGAAAATALAILIGIVVSIASGALFSLLHAFASVSLNADQIISGTAINMIAGALTLFLARNITGSGNIRVQGLPRFDVPILSHIPVIGKLFFSNTYMTTWIILIIVVLSSLLLYKTSFGLRLRSCGENPHATDAAGINVRRIRYGAVLISGALAGLGGCTILVTYSGEFTGSVAGLGFLALASLIFGQWKPLGVVGATLFFGFASTVANVSQIVPAFAAIPSIVFKVFPYVITLVALVIFSKSSAAPRAIGQPFDQGKR